MVMQTQQKQTVVELDAALVWLSETPHYCRNDEDRARWLAWHMGYLEKISTKEQQVVYYSATNSYRIMLAGVQ